MDKPTTSELPIKLRNAMEALVRAANAETGYVVIGAVFSTESIAILGNTKDDPAELLHFVAGIVESKTLNGLVVEQKVLPLN
jgi:hypothetical protein